MRGGRDHSSTAIVSKPVRSPRKTDEVSLTPEQLARKQAFREIVKGVGGFEAAAGFTRVEAAQLHRYCDPKVVQFAPDDVVADLEPLARQRPGWPHLTRLNARTLGFALVATPQCESDTVVSAHAALAEAHKESSEATSGVLEALANGEIDEAEASRWAPEALQAAEAFMRMHALLQRIAGGG